MKRRGPLQCGLLQLLLGIAALGCAAPARSNELPEYRLKAAFLYDFAAFTEWPADVGGTLNVCVYGHDPFGAELDKLNGKAIGLRTVAVHRTSDIESLKTCQVAFIPRTAIGSLPHLLAALGTLPVLVVADSPGAARQGAALSMDVADHRVSFAANLAAARAARLNLSSKLLRLATEVIR